jgi:hypothetical protein
VQEAVIRKGPQPAAFAEVWLLLSITHKGGQGEAQIRQGGGGQSFGQGVARTRDTGCIEGAKQEQRDSLLLYVLLQSRSRGIQLYMIQLYREAATS